MRRRPRGPRGAALAPVARHRRPVRAAASGLVAVTMAAAALTACTPGGEAAAPPATTPRVEVFTWWSSGHEKLAFDVLVSAFRDQYPGTTFVDSGVAGGAGSAAKDVLASRLAAGDPPDTFQVHGGAELAEHVEAGALTPLGPLLEETGLADVLPADVLAQVSVDDEVWAFPADVHRANVVWANADVLAATGAGPGPYASVDAWVAALETVAAAGLTPLSIGSTWTQVHLLEQVLLGTLGPDAYTALWDGTGDASSPEVTAALEDFARIMALTNTDRASLDWEDAAQRVLDGEAAFTLMGDWAQPALQSGGPDDAVWWPAPGTQGVYDVVLDAFTLPEGADDPAAAQDWLRTVATAEAQTPFTQAKGAIPARDDIPTSHLGTYQRAALASFRRDVHVQTVTHGSLLAPDALAELSRAVERFTTRATPVADLQTAIAALVG